MPLGLFRQHLYANIWGYFGENITEILRLANENDGMFCPEWWE